VAALHINAGQKLQLGEAKYLNVYGSRKRFKIFYLHISKVSIMYVMDEAETAFRWEYSEKGGVQPRWGRLKVARLCGRSLLAGSPRVSHHFILIPCLGRQIAFCSVLMAFCSDQSHMELGAWSLQEQEQEQVQPLARCSPVIFPSGLWLLQAARCSLLPTTLVSLVSLFCSLALHAGLPPPSASTNHSRWNMLVLLLRASLFCPVLSLRPCCHTFPIV